MPFLTCTLALRHAPQIALATVIALSALRPFSCEAVNPDSSVIGDWKFINVLDSVDITSIDDEGAKRLLGKIMTIRKDGARFDNYKCDVPDFKTRLVEPSLYLRKEGDVDNSKLRLPHPVTVIDISCATVFMKDRNHAVITWAGYFFAATRVKKQGGQ